MNAAFKMWRHKMPLVGIAILTCMSGACEKEELPVPPYDRGDVIEVQIEMGAGYENQVWYDLGENKVVATNSRFSWDLAFDCSDTGSHIYLNTAVAMTAAPTHTDDLAAEITVEDLHFKTDHPGAHPDSLALAGWWQTKRVWVIDRGYDVSGNARGKYKVRFAGEENGVYKFQFARLNSTEVFSATVTKNNTHNRIAFSFETGEEVFTEPGKDAYDLCFTQYMHIFQNPYMPYLVNGVLLNPYQTAAALDSVLSFSEIGPEQLVGYELSGEADVIGYKWKYYDLDAGVYTVFPELNYIVRDREGFYYKLHFVDFYNAAGEKGYPKMEVKRL